MQKNLNKYNHNKAEVLNKFHISSATLDNWIRIAIPNAIYNNLYNVDIINEYIKREKKLSGRANKKKSTSIEFPKELIKYLNTTHWLDIFLDYITDKQSHDIAQEILSLYKARLAKTEIDNPLASILPDNDLYSYSVAYQILLDSGNKSKTGAYYTPKFIVQEIVNCLVEKDKTFLEPCCGVGFYTIEYIKAYKEKFNTYPNGLIYANELDPISAEITKFNILTLTNNEMPDFVVTCGDGLSLPYNDIDLIITNPPYGIKNTYSGMKTQEIFSHFIHKTLSQYLKPQGIMNFILPASILAVDKHNEIRKYLINHFNIECIKHFGKSFDSVFSDIISLQVQKNYNVENIIKLIDNGNIKTINQKHFIEQNYTLNHIDSDDLEFLTQHYSIPHTTLANSLFSLGIVTGNNSFFIKDKIEPNLTLKTIISGKEIKKGLIDYDNKKYIIYEPEKYQQKPDMALFSKKKIIYKFISNKLVTAIDNTGILTLNSANFIILNSPLKEEYVSALLNSEIINKIYKLKFGNPLKVLKKHLQALPIFLFPKNVQDEIVNNYNLGKHTVNDNIIEENIAKLIKKQKI